MAVALSRKPADGGRDGDGIDAWRARGQLAWLAHAHHLSAIRPLLMPNRAVGASARRMAGARERRN